MTGIPQYCDVLKFFRNKHWNLTSNFIFSLTSLMTNSVAQRRKLGCIRIMQLLIWKSSHQYYEDKQVNCQGNSKSSFLLNSIHNLFVNPELRRGLGCFYMYLESFVFFRGRYTSVFQTFIFAKAYIVSRYGCRNSLPKKIRVTLYPRYWVYKLLEISLGSANL